MEIYTWRFPRHVKINRPNQLLQLATTNQILDRSLGIQKKERIGYLGQAHLPFFWLRWIDTMGIIEWMWYLVTKEGTSRNLEATTCFHKKGGIMSNPRPPQSHFGVWSDFFGVQTNIPNQRTFRHQVFTNLSNQMRCHYYFLSKNFINCMNFLLLITRGFVKKLVTESWLR